MGKRADQGFRASGQSVRRGRFTTLKGADNMGNESFLPSRQGRCPGRCGVVHVHLLRGWMTTIADEALRFHGWGRHARGG